jgi:hypothetical protein
MGARLKNISKYTKFPCLMNIMADLKNSGGKLWWKTSAENYGGKLWRKTLAENFCGKLWRETLVPHKFRRVCRI